MNNELTAAGRLRRLVLAVWRSGSAAGPTPNQLKENPPMRRTAAVILGTAFSSVSLPLPRQSTQRSRHEHHRQCPRRLLRCRAL